MCAQQMMQAFYPVSLEAYVDCNSIIENLKTLKPRVSENRLIVEISLLRKLIEKYNIRIWHVKGANNPADCLTKIKNFSSGLTNSLESGTYDKDGAGEVTGE